MKSKDMKTTVKIILDRECPNIHCACLRDAPGVMKQVLDDLFSAENMNEDCGLQQFQKEMIAKLMTSELKDKIDRVFTSTNVCIGSYETTDENRENFPSSCDTIGNAIAVFNALIQFRMLARVAVESVVKQMGGEKYYSVVLKDFYNNMKNDPLYDEIEKMMSLLV